uniref:Uncharacterized protein n=1 Tax=Anguilla anguilla TaxID=7936 RepID=A0A0E9Q5V5_ANGAN
MSLTLPYQDSCWRKSPQSQNSSEMGMGGPKEDMTLHGPILRAHPDFQLTGLGLGNVRIVSFHPPCQELAPGKEQGAPPPSFPLHQSQVKKQEVKMRGKH